MIANVYDRQCNIVRPFIEYYISLLASMSIQKTGYGLFVFIYTREKLLPPVHPTITWQIGVHPFPYLKYPDLTIGYHTKEIIGDNRGSINTRSWPSLEAETIRLRIHRTV